MKTYFLPAIVVLLVFNTTAKAQSNNAVLWYDKPARVWEETLPLGNGRLGMIDRFTLYSSNLLPTAAEGATTATRIFGGHPHGLTFASQITKVETMRSENTFGTLLRGLQVYGAKVLDGIALVELYAIRG